MTKLKRKMMPRNKLIQRLQYEWAMLRWHYSNLTCHHVWKDVTENKIFESLRIRIPDGAKIFECDVCGISKWQDL